MPSRTQWIERGREAVVGLLAEQLAAPKLELTARISDRPWPGQPKPIDPHLLSAALKDLQATGMISATHATTRGGSKVTVYQPSPIPQGKTRAATDASARKRLLVARHHSWARGTDRTPNLIGAAGEAVVHHSLLEAAPYGYRLIQPSRGEIRALYGGPVPGGPLDNGAWLTTMDQQTQMPGSTFLVPIEVKNVRHWLYPWHWEVYQLLHKAASLANAYPQHPVLPILICRKAHYRTRQLAQHLGFLIFQTDHQYVQPSDRVAPAHFEEVRTELGLADLELTDKANPRLIDWLSKTPPRRAETYSDVWMTRGRHELSVYAQMRQTDLPWSERYELLKSLRDDVAAQFEDDDGEL